MRQISYEKVHSRRISTDHWVDCERAKQFFDYFTRNQKLVGFLQKIEMNPFSFLCLSQIQLDIWKKVENINPVWFFDATGNINKRVQGNATPLFYSIVCHDFVSLKFIFFTNSKNAILMIIIPKRSKRKYFP